MLPVPLQPALTVRDVNGWSADGQRMVSGWSLGGGRLASMAPAGRPAGARQPDVHQHRPQCGAAGGTRHQCSFHAGRSGSIPAPLGRSSCCDGLEKIQGRRGRGVKTLAPEVHPYRYPRWSEAVSAAVRRRCDRGLGNVTKQATNPLSDRTPESRADHIVVTRG